LLTLTAINYVHVNGRSLYIVDWPMVVVEGGNVPHRVKGGGSVPEGKFRGTCPSGICPGSNVRIPLRLTGGWGGHWTFILYREKSVKRRNDL